MLHISNLLLKIVKYISILTIMASVHASCSFLLYQEEIPEMAKKLRRF